MVLSTLRWRAEPVADGSLRLTWSGPAGPQLAEAVVVRQATPAVRSAHALQRVSPTELVLPDAADWSPGTIELSTTVLHPGPVPLRVTVRQVLVL